MSANPIPQRELLGTLRAPRVVTAMIGLVAVLAAVVLLRWPANAQADAAGTVAAQVLKVFAYGTMVAVVLLAPALPATSIIAERERVTLALLHQTRLGPWSIASGKFVASLGYALLLLVLSLPAAAAVFVIGGISLTDQLLPLYIVLALLACQCVGVSLAVSAVARRSAAALRGAYAVVITLTIATVAPYAFAVGKAGLDPGLLAALDWLRSLSPVPAITALAGDTTDAVGGLVSGVVLKYAAMAVLTAAVGLAVAAIRLQPRRMDQPRKVAAATEERSGREQTYRRIMYLWFFDPQRRTSAIGFYPVKIAVCVALAVPLLAAAVYTFPTDFEDKAWDALLVEGAPSAITGTLALGLLFGALVLLTAANPVSVKEQRTSQVGRGHWMARLLFACAALSLLGMLLVTQQTETLGVETAGGVVVALQAALIVMLTPSLGSPAIAAEREHGGWLLLRNTPLRPHTIVLGKLLSAALVLILVLVATLPGYAVLLYVEPERLNLVIKVLAVLAVTAGTALVLSAGLGSLFRSTAAATVASYVVLIALWGGTLLIWLGRDAPFTHAAVERALTLNPLAVALSLLESPGFSGYDLLPGHWWWMGGLTLFGLALLVVQVWRLNRPQ